jgi:hypothetical protein
MPRVKLQRGMYLVITKALPFETALVVGWSFSYADVWQYWIDHPEGMWELAYVGATEVQMPDGIEEHLYVKRLQHPMPPKRMASRLALDKGRRYT